MMRQFINLDNNFVGHADAVMRLIDKAIHNIISVRQLNRDEIVIKMSAKTRWKFIPTNVIFDDYKNLESHILGCVLIINDGIEEDKIIVEEKEETKYYVIPKNKIYNKVLYIDKSHTLEYTRERILDALTEVKNVTKCTCKEIIIKMCFDTFAATLNCYASCYKISCNRYRWDGYTIIIDNLMLPLTIHIDNSKRIKEEEMCIRENEVEMLNKFYGDNMKKDINRKFGLPKPMEIKKVIFNKPATIILWEDGSKTVVKCQPDEFYDKEKGFVMAYIKKYLGNKGNYNNFIKKYVHNEPDAEKSI